MAGIYLVFPLVDFLNALLIIFRFERLWPAFGTSIYRTSYQLYAKVWRRLEKVFWPYAYYIAATFSKTSQNEV